MEPKLREIVRSRQDLDQQYADMRKWWVDSSSPEKLILLQEFIDATAGEPDHFVELVTTLTDDACEIMQRFLAIGIQESLTRVAETPPPSDP